LQQLYKEELYIGADKRENKMNQRDLIRKNRRPDVNLKGIPG
jgi:hypothetical protein